MDGNVKKLVKATNLNAQYDACAKQLLSNKIILAHILKGTVEEFKEMEPTEIVFLIEGESYVSEVPVDPGETNQVMTQSGNKLVGNNTEDTELGEGKVYFDIIFYVRTKDRVSQILVNLEAQRSANPGYYVKNRAIYYTSRMLSSQKERDFVKSNYNNLLKTYSIWLCFNLDENCLNHLHMVDTPLLGNHNWEGDTELLNVVLVGLDKKLTKTAINDVESDLHYLLGTLFSNKLDASEKISLLDARFNLKEDKKIRKELGDMCNLSYGILEEGIEEGIERGIKQGRKNVIREMLLDHQSYSLIRKYTGAAEEEIRKIEKELLVEC